MRHKYYILDAEHRPVAVSMIEWAMWWGDMTNRLVDYTQVTSQIEISTIFLGLDHCFVGDGPPILFETMIFGGPLDEHQWRYVSWDDAESGHKAAVRMAREAIGQKVTT